VPERAHASTPHLGPRGPTSTGRPVVPQILIRHEYQSSAARFSLGFGIVSSSTSCSIWLPETSPPSFFSGHPPSPFSKLQHFQFVQPRYLTYYMTDLSVRMLPNSEAARPPLLRAPGVGPCERSTQRRVRNTPRRPAPLKRTDAVPGAVRRCP
jgi:hypothetical protein